MKPNFHNSTARLRVLCAILGLMCSHMTLSAQQLRFGMADYSLTTTTTAGVTTSGDGGWGSLDIGTETWTYGSGALASNYHRLWVDSASDGFVLTTGIGYTWTWDIAKDELIGATVVDWRTNVTYYSNPTRTEEYSYHRAYADPGKPFDSGLRFGAPNGTYSTPDNGHVVNVSTVGGIYTEGLPGSTNEHFYRVKLSLSHLDLTPMLTSSVQSILGAPVDGYGNAYMWLRDASLHQGKPVFKPGVNPSFYYYTAEPQRADQLGTLIVSTISRGSTWPGTRPEGMAQRLGYPSDEGYFSDDQFAFDYIMSSPLSSLVEAAINAILLARGLPVVWEVDRSRGGVTTLTPEDRQYMTLVLLARSVNEAPPSEMDFTTLERFKGTNYVYRLLNELAVEAAAYNGSFAHAVNGRHIQRKQTKLGKTKIEYEDDVILRVKIWPGTPLEYIEELGLDKDDLNPIIDFTAQALSNEDGAGHNTLSGGSKGSESINLICAGRAGTVLRTLEQPLLRRMPPDFSCWATFFVDPNSNYVDRRVKLSLNSTTTWPTFYDYQYDYDRRRYRGRSDHPQIENPFEGFLTLGP